MRLCECGAVAPRMYCRHGTDYFGTLKWLAPSHILEFQFAGTRFTHNSFFSS